MAMVLLYLRVATMPADWNPSPVLQGQHCPLARLSVEADLAEIWHIIIFKYWIIESYFHAPVPVDIWVLGDRPRVASRRTVTQAYPRSGELTLCPCLPPYGHSSR